jgi:hypothetical protein
MSRFEESLMRTQVGRFVCLALLATVFAFLPQSASGQATVVLDWQAALANAGAGPHPIPGAGSPWADLTVNGYDGTLLGFDGIGGDGWNGLGTPASPYRLTWDDPGIILGQVVSVAPGTITELNPHDPNQGYSVTICFRTSADAGATPVGGGREGLVEWVETLGAPSNWGGMNLSYYDPTPVDGLGQLQIWDCAAWSPANLGPPDNLSGNTWYHAAVVKQDLLGPSPPTVDMYLDGTLVYTQIYPTTVPTCLGTQALEMVVGAGNPGGTGVYDRTLEGEIAELRIYDGALTGPQVLADYNLHCSSLVNPVCGNNVQEGAEECDGSDLGACPIGPCDPDCTCPDPVCGNNIVEAGEECDGTDEGICPGIPCVGCLCDYPAVKILELRADQANGTSPYPLSPGNASPWVIAAGWARALRPSA